MKKQQSLSDMKIFAGCGINLFKKNHLRLRISHNIKQEINVEVNNIYASYFFFLIELSTFSSFCICFTSTVKNEIKKEIKNKNKLKIKLRMLEGYHEFRCSYRINKRDLLH